VEEKTHEKIKDLIQSDSLNSLTRLVLINAVYFKGSWAKKFDSSFTTKQTFYVSDANNKQVDMMKMTAKFPYYETPDYQVLGMPYEGNDVFMYVILPRERFGLANVLKKLDGKTLLELVSKRAKSEVHVSLPRFKLESTHALNQMLKNLGMKKAFDPIGANFSGIAEDGEDLFISEVLQKAFIETNEKGSEAAAATSLQIQMLSASFPAEQLDFVADHPFAYSIVTRSNDNAVLFNGLLY